MAHPPRSIDDIDFDNLSEEDIAWLDEQLDGWFEGDEDERPTPTPPRWHALVREVLAARVAHHLDPTAPRKKIGDFEAESLLGTGANGCVFKVYDPTLGRFVALKLCISPTEGAGERLMAEAQTLAQLKHANIVRVYETGKHEEDTFFVMELVEGPSMYDYVTKGEEQPPWEELVLLFCEAGEAIAAAHDRDIIHGDIKPSNILLELDTMTPYVADFGLARMRGADREQAGALGTLPYMSPQLLRGGLSDEHSDQYAFCVALWECLDDGIPPYGGRDTEDFLLEIEEAWPTTCNEAVPQKVRDVLRKGMSAEPSERFSSMRELVHHLRLALGPRLVESTSGPSGKNGGLVALVIVLTAGLLIQSLRASPPQTASNDPHPEQVEPLERDVETHAPEPTDMAPKVKGCVKSAWQPSEAATKICDSIRAQDFEGANAQWITAHSAADPQVADEWVSLIRDNMSIANTFVDEGKSVNANTWHHIACLDYRAAREHGVSKEAEELISSALKGISCK